MAGWVSATTIAPHGQGPWKNILDGAGAATTAQAKGGVNAPEGFKVERIYGVPKGTQGSDELGLLSFDELLDRGRAALKGEVGEDVRARSAAIRPDDTAMMVFTSGSTGLPKAAEISYGNIHSGSAIAEAVFGDYGPGTDVLSYLPLCHIAEQAVTVINSLSRQFVMNFGESLRTITLDLREVAPQVFFGVPRIWEKMQAGVIVQDILEDIAVPV